MSDLRYGSGEGVPMTEFGIFSDEGLLEGQFWSREVAEETLRTTYPEDDAHVAECCREHPEQERETCEECNAEDGGDEECNADDDDCTSEEV